MNKKKKGDEQIEARSVAEEKRKVVVGRSGVGESGAAWRASPWEIVLNLLNSKAPKKRGESSSVAANSYSNTVAPGSLVRTRGCW